MKLINFILFSLSLTLLSGCIAPEASHQNGDEKDPTELSWGLGLPEEDGLADDPWRATAAEKALVDPIVQAFLNRTGCDLPTHMNLELPIGHSHAFMMACGEYEARTEDVLAGDPDYEIFRGIVEEARWELQASATAWQDVQSTGHVGIDGYVGLAAKRALGGFGILRGSERYFDGYNATGNEENLRHAVMNALLSKDIARNGLAFAEAVKEVAPQCETDYGPSLDRLRHTQEELVKAVDSAREDSVGLDFIPWIENNTLPDAQLVLENEVGVVAQIAYLLTAKERNNLVAIRSPVLPTMGEGYHIVNEAIRNATYAGVREYVERNIAFEPHIWYEDPEMPARVLAFQDLEWPPVVAPCS